jgi:Holliday junction resolvase RusA-like endonuclease
VIDFFIEGTPVGQPRATQLGNGRAFYREKTIGPWKAAIMWGCKAHRPKDPLAGPLNVWLCFYFPRPKYHFKKDGQLKVDAPLRHIVRPDADNAMKAVLDALTKCGFWLDDCQVCDAEIKKIYASGGPPGVRIVIYTLNP